MGVPFTNPEDPPVSTNDPLTAPFVRAWQAVHDQIMADLLAGALDEKDDPPDANQPETELEKACWATVGLELLTLASERRRG